MPPLGVPSANRTIFEPVPDLDKLDAEIAAYLGGPHRSRETAWSYGHGWRTWTRFCTRRDLDPMSASVKAVELFVGEAARGLLRVKGVEGGMTAPASLDVLLAAVKRRLCEEGIPWPHAADPTTEARLRRIRRGYRHVYAQQHEPDPEVVSMTRDHLQTLFGFPLTWDAAAMCRRALVLLALDTQLTSNDLGGLTRAAIQDGGAGSPAILTHEGHCYQLTCDHSSRDWASAVECTRCALTEYLDFTPGFPLDAPLLAHRDGKMGGQAWATRRLSDVAPWGAVQFRGQRLQYAADATPADRLAVRTALAWSCHPKGLAYLRCRAHTLLCFNLGLGPGEAQGALRRQHVEASPGSVAIQIPRVPEPVERPHTGGPLCLHCSMATWVAVFDATRDSLPGHQIFCRVNHRRLFVGPTRVGHTDQYIRDAQTIAGVDLGLTGRSPRLGFARLHAAAEGTLVETRDALRLVKPETAQKYRSATGASAHGSARAMLARLGEGA